MKTTNRSREELRFVTSAEQIAPYLEDLRSDTSSSVGDADSLEHTDDDSTQYRLNVPLVLPPATSALATAVAIAVPNIYEEYVNFIDLSILNPIVAACDCQRDQLIESEISERRIWMRYFLFYFYPFIRPAKWLVMTMFARRLRTILTNESCEWTHINAQFWFAPCSDSTNAWCPRYPEIVKPNHLIPLLLVHIESGASKLNEKVPEKLLPFKFSVQLHLSIPCVPLSSITHPLWIRLLNGAVAHSFRQSTRRCNAFVARFCEKFKVHSADEF